MWFFKLISYLPFRLLYGISNGLFFVVYRIFGYRKKIVRENLQRSFPESSPKELEHLCKKFYHHLCDLIVESLKLLSIPEQVFRQRVRISNINLPEKYLKQGQSIIVICGHTGNWEWLLQACAVYSKFPIDAVYKPLSNKFFDRFMLKIRSRFEAYPLPMKEVPRSIIKRRNIVHVLAMVADQTPPKTEIQFSNRFLNQVTPWFVGAEKIARGTDMPVLFVGMKKRSRGFYEVFFEEIALPPYSKTDMAFPIIQNFSEKLEKNIREDPAHWLWSHRRWKHSL